MIYDRNNIFKNTVSSMLLGMPIFFISYNRLAGEYKGKNDDLTSGSSGTATHHENRSYTYSRTSEEIYGYGKFLFFSELKLEIDGFDETKFEKWDKIFGHFNMKDEKKKTPLIYATAACNVEAVKLLLKKPGKVNLELEDSDSSTALMYAMRNLGRKYGQENAERTKQVEIVQELIHAGAHPNKQLDEQGLTVLILASQNGHSGIIDALLNQRNANHILDLNQATKSGTTAVMVALRHGHINIAKKLIEAGAEFHHKNQRQETALSLAIKQYRKRSPNNCSDALDYIKLIKKIIANQPSLLNERDQDNNTPFVDIFKLQNREIFDLMAQQKEIDVNQKDNGGTTPFMYACCSLPDLALKWMSDINLEAGNESGMTPLIWAIQAYNDLKENPKSQKSYEKLIKKIIKQGQDLNQRPSKDHANTALELAMKNGNFNIAKRIIGQWSKNGKSISFFKEVLSDINKLGVQSQDEHNKIIKLLEKHAKVNPSNGIFYQS